MLVRKPCARLSSPCSSPAGAGCFSAPITGPPPDLRVDPTAARVERGRYLVEHVSACLGCHSQHERERFSMPPKSPRGTGGPCWEEPVVPGLVCAQNITNHPDGVAGWTDGQLARAIREGVNREDDTLFPMMPYTHYRSMSDEDVEAVIAYLRTATAAPGTVRKTDIDWPVSMFINFAPKPLEAPVPSPDPKNGVEYGRYLATIGGCVQCHSPTDDKKAIDRERLFAGGQEFKDAMVHVIAPNLTPHPTGVSRFTRDQFIARFHAFRDPASIGAVEPAAQTVMPWWAYAGMEAEDLGAIYDYLLTLPPIENAVEPFVMKK